MSQDWAAAQTGFLTGDRVKDARNVTILLDTIAAVSSNADIDSLMRSVIDKAIEVTNAERGLLLLKAAETGKLEIKVARDKMGNPLPTGLKYSTSIPAKVFETGKSETLMDAAGGGDVALGQSILDLRLVSVMCAPLTTAEHETIGVLYIDSQARRRRASPRRDLELFTALGSQCGLAIRNATLVEAYLEQQRLEHDLHVARRTSSRACCRARRSSARASRSPATTGRVRKRAATTSTTSPCPNRRLGVVIGDVSAATASARRCS